MSDPTTGANETHEATFAYGEVVYIGPFVVEGQCEIGWGLHVDGAIDRWEAGDRIVSAHRVLDAADVAALRHLVADHKLVQTEVRQALRDTTTADLARIDRIFAADAARTEGQG